MTVMLVVAAHPDDEILGCGATIARLATEGWEIHILILAEGETSRQVTRSREKAGLKLSSLKSQARKAAKIVGARSVRFADFPDNRMDGVELLDVVKRVEAEIERVKPSRVLTHRRSDVNVDHGVVHDAVTAATRLLPGTRVREVWYFEVPSSTEWRPPTSATVFSPSLFVDVGATIATKLLALEAYASEMRDFPHPRSVEAVEHLARWRGASAGVQAAEAFEIGRQLI